MKAVDQRNIAWIAVLLMIACSTHRDRTRARYISLAELQATYGALITTGNHPTPDQHGTGDRIGFFRGTDGNVWGLPLSITDDGEVVGCAPAALRNAEVTDKYPAGSTILGSMNEPTGWRGGTGKLEILLRDPSGVIQRQALSGGNLANGPACWAQEPPGPPQQLLYYRLAPAKQPG